MLFRHLTTGCSPTKCHFRIFVFCDKRSRNFRISKSKYRNRECKPDDLSNETGNRASDKKNVEKATLLSTLDPRHWCINLVSRHGNSSSASMSHLSQNNHHRRPAGTARACSPPPLFHRSAQALRPTPPPPRAHSAFSRHTHTRARATHTTPWFVKQGSDVVYATFILVSRVFSEREIPGSWSTWLRGGVERRRIRCNDHFRAARIVRYLHIIHAAH